MRGRVPPRGAAAACASITPYAGCRRSEGCQYGGSAITRSLRGEDLTALTDVHGPHQRARPSPTCTALTDVHSPHRRARPSPTCTGNSLPR